MIRPVMGTNPYFIGIEENQENAGKMALYPNPASNVVRIEGVDNEMADEIVIYDLAGRAVKKYQYCNELNINDLQNGVYLLRVIMNDGSCETSKLLISK
ncbi:MAG: T9SS type A sorting domain-containing protein, partial [Bacteroidales bacterium]|nr:T9SS type A sorting domain-containing protein [Bacteroidales bacterium]